MNKYKHLNYWFYVSFFSTWLIIMVVGCKKSSIPSKTPDDSKFSFTYKGSQYTLPYRSGIAEWGIEGSVGIFINRPDLFNGIIHFPSPNCAYLVPRDNGGHLDLTGNCQLINTSGAPLDSIAVYLYQSGTANVSYKNCRPKTQYDPITGTYFTFDVCDANGTFDLVLKNKENKTIEITNGTFEMYSFKR